jgi:hypothetical protein
MKTQLKKFRILREQTVWIETFIEAKTQAQAEKLLDTSDFIRNDLKWTACTNLDGCGEKSSDTFFCDGHKLPFLK